MSASAFFKAAAKVMVIGVVAIDGKKCLKCLIIFALDGILLDNMLRHASIPNQSSWRSTWAMPCSMPGNIC
jgi:hypothetical protein